MKLSKEFWEEQKGLMLIGSGGSLRFTAGGKAHYAPMFAKYGFSISSISSKERLEEIMGWVIAGELDETTRQLEQMLRDPETRKEERDLINQILSISTDMPSSRPKLRLVQ